MAKHFAPACLLRRIILFHNSCSHLVTRAGRRVLTTGRKTLLLPTITYILAGMRAAPTPISWQPRCGIRAFERAARMKLTVHARLGGTVYEGFCGRRDAPRALLRQAALLLLLSSACTSPLFISMSLPSLFSLLRLLSACLLLLYSPARLRSTNTCHCSGLPHGYFFFSPQAQLNKRQSDAAYGRQSGRAYLNMAQQAETVERKTGWR